MTELRDVMSAFEGLNGVYRAYNAILAGTPAENQLRQIYEKYREQLRLLSGQKEAQINSTEDAQNKQNISITFGMKLKQAEAAALTEMTKVMSEAKPIELPASKGRGWGQPAKELEIDLEAMPDIMSAMAAAASFKVIKPVTPEAPKEELSSADIKVSAKGPTYTEFGGGGETVSEYIPVVFGPGWPIKATADSSEKTAAEPRAYVLKFKTGGGPKFIKGQEDRSLYKDPLAYDWVFPFHDFPGGEKEAYENARQYGLSGYYPFAILKSRGTPEIKTTIGAHDYKSPMSATTTTPYPKKEPKRKKKVLPGDEMDIGALDVDIGAEEPEISPFKASELTASELTKPTKPTKPTPKPKRVEFD